MILSLFIKKVDFRFSYQYNSKMLNIDYAFVTGLFNENTLISNDIGISRSIENLQQWLQFVGYEN